MPRSGRIVPSRRNAVALALLLSILLIASFDIHRSAAVQSEPAAATTSAPAAPAAAAPLPEDRYGLWTLAPALVAIGVAVALRQVFPALILGILTASAMMMYCLPAEARFGGEPSIVLAVRLAIERYLLGALTDPSHRGLVDVTRLQTVLFTLTIAGMVGIVHANGGTAAFVRLIGRLAVSRRRGQLATFFAGLAIFFDDYSNCMIIGPTMRPMLDRLRVSREKLSFILDATAAPVASLALFGTWIGTEVGFIQAGLDQLAADNALPEFLRGVRAYQAFIYSLPYRFYAIFALVLVFVIAVTNRDYGPMLRAERRVQQRAEDDESASAVRVDASRWWYAAAPVGSLVVATTVILALTGWYAAPPPRTIANILTNANAYLAILYGATIAVNLAFLISVATRTLRLGDAIEAMMTGVQRILPAVIVLIFAWALSDGMKDLHLGQVAVRELRTHAFSPHLLPLLIFTSAGIVSFATGTSWGTMGILCPVAVLLAGHLAADLPPDEALTLFYATVGSVLAGAVFGDHCSPISDTTVLSAIAAQCPLEAHVWTQLPYALTAAAMEIVAGDLLCGYLGLPVWIGLAIGAVATLLVVWVLGRPVQLATAARSP